MFVQIAVQRWFTPRKHGKTTTRTRCCPLDGGLGEPHGRRHIGELQAFNVMEYEDHTFAWSKLVQHAVQRADDLARLVLRRRHRNVRQDPRRRQSDRAADFAPPELADGHSRGNPIEKRLQGMRVAQPGQRVHEPEKDFLYQVLRLRSERQRAAHDPPNHGRVPVPDHPGRVFSPGSHQLHQLCVGQTARREGAQVLRRGRGRGRGVHQRSYQGSRPLPDVRANRI